MDPHEPYLSYICKLVSQATKKLQKSEGNKIGKVQGININSDSIHKKC